MANRQTVSLNLFETPVLRATRTGVPICNIRGAHNTGEGESRTSQAFKAVVLGSEAEVVAKQLQKGDFVEVTLNNPTVEKYTDPTTGKTYETTVGFMNRVRGISRKLASGKRVALSFTLSHAYVAKPEAAPAPAAEAATEVPQAEQPGNVEEVAL